jgi:hypothetical protein
MGFADIRIGFAGASFNKHKRAPDASCSTGGMYITPAAGQSVDTSKPLTIAWNPTCLSPPDGSADIYLYAPAVTAGRIHVWTSVPFAPGKYTLDLKPKWWNSTNSVNLQFAIVDPSMPSYMNSMPAGPIFAASYALPANGKPPSNADTSKPDSDVTNVGALSSKSSPSGGAIAAAVLLPILALIALCVGLWIRRSRQKGQVQRKRWSEAVDKRMSTISTDWKSVTPGGAKEAIRQSMVLAQGSNRMSSFTFGGPRPQSTASDMGVAGIGARGRGLYQHENETFSYDSAPQMAQLRPGINVASTAQRVSRVSFANDPRPKSRYTEKSVYGDMPPVPQIGTDQASGPLTLTAEDIRARMEGVDKGRSSMDGILPALSMMRTGGGDISNVEGDDYLLWEAPSTPQSPPALPAPVPTLDRTPVGMMPMPTSANVMSPDDMMRAYAARAQSPSNPTFPARAATGNTMRTLYSPATSGTNVMGGVGLSGNNRMSVTRFAEDEAYIGTAS